MEKTPDYWTMAPHEVRAHMDAAPRSEFTDKERADRARRLQRNAARRAMNAALRELCGTSARAAREDMGI